MARGHIAVTALLVGSLLTVGVVPTYASAFPGDNGKLTFSRFIPSFGGTNILAINPDGTGEVNLTPNGPGNNDEPSVSPDGTKVVFVTDRDFVREIYVMNIDGSRPTRLTTTTVSSQAPDQPTWSPDGLQIAFVRARQIWTMNADGTAQTQLTSDSTSHEAPSWSPDGLSIAFARRFQPGDAGSRIYVMNADGTGAFPISGNTGLDGVGQLSWSPDGAWVAFVTVRNGGGEIWLAASDGTGESADALVKCCRGATSPPGGGNPAWSPDGTLLAFESSGLSTDPEYPKHSIFVTDAATGTSFSRLTHGNGDGRVNWGPAVVTSMSAGARPTSGAMSAPRLSTPASTSTMGHHRRSVAAPSHHTPLPGHSPHRIP